MFLQLGWGGVEWELPEILHLCHRLPLSDSQPQTLSFINAHASANSNRINIVFLSHSFHWFRGICSGMRLMLSPVPHMPPPSKNVRTTFWGKKKCTKKCRTLARPPPWYIPVICRDYICVINICRDHYPPEPDGSPLPVAWGWRVSQQQSYMGSVCAAVSGWCPVYRDYIYIYIDRERERESI